MGQLSVMLSKSGKFAYGYVIKAELPMVGSDFLKPYFRQNLSVNEWRGLVRLNRLVMDENSPLRKGAAEIMRGWAAGILGNAAYEVKINLYEIEPYHRLSSDESYLYVAGSKIIYDVGGLEFPFYTRMYFFRNNGHIDLIMLITPDEGKNPLLYALDDLSKAAAKEAYATIMKGQDLSVLLAKDQV